MEIKVQQEKRKKLGNAEKIAKIYIKSQCLKYAERNDIKVKGTRAKIYDNQQMQELIDKAIQTTQDYNIYMAFLSVLQFMDYADLLNKYSSMGTDYALNGKESILKDLEAWIDLNLYLHKTNNIEVLNDLPLTVQHLAPIDTYDLMLNETESIVTTEYFYKWLTGFNIALDLIIKILDIPLLLVYKPNIEDVIERYKIYNNKIDRIKEKLIKLKEYDEENSFKYLKLLECSFIKKIEFKEHILSDSTIAELEQYIRDFTAFDSTANQMRFLSLIHE